MPCESARRTSDVQSRSPTSALSMACRALSPNLGSVDASRSVCSGDIIGSTGLLCKIYRVPTGRRPGRSDECNGDNLQRIEGRETLSDRQNLDLSMSPCEDRPDRNAGHFADGAIIYTFCLGHQLPAISMTQ